MTISLIVAASTNNAIGKDNKLLWNLPNDMKFFKDTTWGMTVIMGRKTYEALNKILPGRTNIVITKQQNWKAENVWVAKNIDDALKLAATTNCTICFPPISAHQASGISWQRPKSTGHIFTCG